VIPLDHRRQQHRHGRAHNPGRRRHRHRRQPGRRQQV